jgi:hypothetical protein
MRQETQTTALTEHANVRTDTDTDTGARGTEASSDYQQCYTADGGDGGDGDDSSGNESVRDDNIGENDDLSLECVEMTTDLFHLRH